MPTKLKLVTKKLKKKHEIDIIQRRIQKCTFWKMGCCNLITDCSLHKSLRNRVFITICQSDSEYGQNLRGEDCYKRHLCVECKGFWKRAHICEIYNRCGYFGCSNKPEKLRNTKLRAGNQPESPPTQPNRIASYVQAAMQGCRASRSLEARNCKARQGFERQNSACSVCNQACCSQFIYIPVACLIYSIWI